MQNFAWQKSPMTQTSKCLEKKVQQFDNEYDSSTLEFLFILNHHVQGHGVPSQPHWLRMITSIYYKLTTG